MEMHLKCIAIQNTQIVGTCFGNQNFWFGQANTTLVAVASENSVSCDDLTAVARSHLVVVSLRNVCFLVANLANSFASSRQDMSTFFPNTDRSLIERVMIHILRRGQIPTHIGFIMDGNRRYAKKLHVEKFVGHARGFEKLAETLSWCRDLGITQATVYAFSIENFKRPQDEVDGLMTLFRQQFQKLIEEFAKFDSYEICVRVYGRLDLLPLDIQQSIAKVVLRTANHSRSYLNVCFAYTSREEMSNAMNDLKECAANGIIHPDDITNQTLARAMYSLGMQDPDILLRTSGEIRLSDFLLWQTSFSYIFFVKELWPDFSIWSFFRGILNYQAHFVSMQEQRARHEANLHKQDMKLCLQMYQNYVRICNGKEAESKPLRVNGYKSHIDTATTKDDPVTMDQFITQRNQRLERCFEFIRNKRLNKLRDLVKDIDLDKAFQQSNGDACHLTDKINNNANGIDHCTTVKSQIMNNGHVKAL